MNQESKKLIDICGITYYRIGQLGNFVIAICNFGSDMIKPRIWTLDKFKDYCKTKWWLNDLDKQL